MKSAVITIGDELLIGQIVNSNQAYIAERLNSVGVSVERMLTVGDDMEAILGVFRECWSSYEIVVVTGGLGPTHDDITKKAVCRFFNTGLVSRQDLRESIQRLLARRGSSWGPTSEEQTLFPVGAEVIPNPVGTAAGIRFDEPGKHFMVLPGVPYEMKEMIEHTVIPLLKSEITDSVIRHLTLRTTGATESMLAGLIGDVNPLLEGARLAFLPSPTGVRLRITLHDTNAETAGRRLRVVEEKIRAKVGQYIYGTGEEELEDVLGRILAERKLTIAVAESCTGGLIANKLTDVSGSSRYVERALVTYSNRSKMELLGVPEALLERVGAVSREVAEAMAAGVRTRSGTDIGLSTTGIAGPTGGTEEKPVGLVWIGYSDGSQTFAKRYLFGEGRTRVKVRASQAALELVRRAVLGLDQEGNKATGTDATSQVVHRV
jgi:nicotinamide-nucleotide amidase